MSDKKTVARFIDVDVSYSGGVDALNHVSLDVYEGDFLGVIGPNGAGKTTLLNVLLGLTPPSRGSVSLFGGHVSPSGLRRVGYVPQKVATADANSPFTVYETVLMGRAPRAGLLHRLGRKDHDRAEEVLKLLGIHDLMSRKMGELSGGQSQRVLIAKALASEPDLLILDEPTSGVDSPSRIEIYRILSELNRERGITMMLSTHDIGVVKRLTNRAAFLHGFLIFQGPTSELSDQVLSKMYDYPIEVTEDGRVCDYPLEHLIQHDHT
jgi:zinc transport system ATP-binding protein